MFKYLDIEMPHDQDGISGSMGNARMITGGVVSSSRNEKGKEEPATAGEAILSSQRDQDINFPIIDSDQIGTNEHDNNNNKKPKGQ